MTDQPSLDSRPTWLEDSDVTALLGAQRNAVKTAFGSNPTEPKVGEVWLSDARWLGVGGTATSAMLVVLRAFVEAWSARPLFDVAPVSDDERLASEWSLILDASRSGLGIPLVIHIDVQSTTTSSMLVHHVGALSELARLDLDSLMHAYAIGNGSVIELHVGRLGRVSIRFHPEWDEFSRELFAVSQAFAAPLARERMARNTPRQSYEDVKSDPSHLAVASGAQSDDTDVPQMCRWVYLDTAPYLRPLRVREDSSFQWLGEALVFYFSERSAGNIQDSDVPAILDLATFERLEPFLNVALTRLVSESRTDRMQGALREHAGHAPNYGDFKIIMKCLRVAKTCTLRTDGMKPMRLAARRPTPH